MSVSDLVSKLRLKKLSLGLGLKIETLKIYSLRLGLKMQKLVSLIPATGRAPLNRSLFAAKNNKIQVGTIHRPNLANRYYMRSLVIILNIFWPKGFGSKNKG